MTTKTTFLLTLAVLTAGFARGQCTIQQQGVTGTNVICSGSGTVNVASSETGVNYYLRNNSDNSIVAGPIEGTGSTLTMSTGVITSPTTFNVNAVEATKALDFNPAMQQYVGLGTGINSALAGTSQVTVEAWINLESINGLPTIIGNFGQSYMQFLFRIDNGKPTFWVGNQSNNWSNAQGQAYVPLNQWVHLAGSWDGSTIRVYMNGVLVGSTNHSGTFLSAPQEMRIGASLTSELFNGRIDNLRIWNTVKTDTQINNDKSVCLTGTEANLLAYYDFENITGTTLNDLTANNYDGTLINSPLVASGIDFCSTCSLQMATTPTISVMPLTAQSLLSNSASLTCAGITAVNLLSSDAGASYFLRDNLNNNVVAGPVFGTSGPITLNTNTTATTTYNVYAKKAGLINLTGTALSLDGVDDYVNIPGSTTDLTNGDFTIEAWVNTTGINEAILTKGNASGWDGGEKCFYINASGNPAFVGHSNGYIIGAGTVVNDGTWHHVAVTWNYSTGTGKIYVDGIESTVYEDYQPNWWDNATDNLKLGFPNAGEAPNYFSGSLDEVRIWNTTRTASQLSANMTSCLFGNEPNLVAYYQFENETAPAITDISGGIENGVIMNASASPWMTGLGCGNVCDITMSTLFTTTVSPLADKAVSPANSSVTCFGNSTVTVADTDPGVGYFLRDDANDNIVSGPFYGNGSAGTLNTGDITSTTTYNVFAKNLSALQFDGTNDYIESPAITISRLFTYETWIKTNDPSPEWSGIITTSTVSGSGMFTQLAMSPTGTLRWESNFPNSSQDMTTVINDNVWHHIALVSDGSNLTFYVDGNIEYTMPFVAGSFDRKMLFMSERNKNAFVPGKMDEARIWNVARTQSQIQAGMNTCLTGTEPGLVIYYNFQNNPMTGVVTDMAGDAENGILYNMDLSKAWVDGTSACGSCSMEMTDKAIVTVNSISDQAINASPASLCNSGSSNIVVPSSDASVTYTLRNDLNDNIVAGPVSGNGAALSLNTGTISATTTYNVYAERIADSHSALSIPNNTYVSVPSGINISNQSFTVEFWAKRNTVNSYNFAVGQGTGNYNNGLHIGFRDNNNFTFAFFGDDLDVNIPANTDGNYHHWSCVYTAGVSGTDRYIYLDGALVASDDATGDFTGTGAFNIGANPGGSQSLNGEIDEFRVWNAARTQSEIQNDMNKCVLPNTTGLIAYYDMTPTGSATLADKSGNNLNGTFVNMDASAYVANGPAITCTYCQAEMTQTATVTVNTSTSSTIAVTACDNYTAPDGAVYTTSGTQTAVIQNMAGCDSTITINLTIRNSSSSTVTESSCDSFTWPVNGTTYTAGGAYTATIPNMAGCDSTITLNLTIRNSTSSTVTESSCDSFTWPVNGTTYTAGGSYAATIQNTAGCDSTITLNLTIHNSANSTVTESSCDSFTWPVNGTTYTAGGTYTATVATTEGCDSLITLNLTIHNSATSTVTETSCGSFTWPVNGITYTTGGTYTAIIATTEGCDSTITLNLTLNNVDATTTTSGTTITANASNASYAWLDCNTQTLIAGENAQTFTALFNGSYAAIVTDNGCVDTSACVVINNVSTPELHPEINLTVYPNPTSGNITIYQEGGFTKTTVQLISVDGKVSLVEGNFTGNKLTLDMSSYASGIYFMEIIEKEKVTRIKIMKN